MGFLVAEMFACLLVAALIGLFFGWLLGRLRRSRQTEQAIESLQGELQSLQSSHDRTRQVLAAAQARLGQVDSLSGELSELGRRSRDLDATAAGLQASLHEQGGSLATLQSELARWPERLNHFEQRIGAQADGLDNLRSETKSGLAAVPKLAQDLAVVSGLRGIVERHEEALAAVEPGLAKRDKRIAALDEQIAGLAGLAAKVESQAGGFGVLRGVVERHEEALGAVKPSFAERDSRFAAVDERISELEALYGAIDRQSVELGELRGVLTQHAAGLAAVEPSFGEQDSRIAALEAMLSRVQEWRDAWKARLEAFSGSLQHVETAVQNVSESLSRDLEERESRITELESTLAAQHEVDEELRSGLQEPARAVASLSPRVEAVEALAPRLETLGAEVKAASGRVEQQAGLLATLPGELSDQNERLARLEAGVERQRSLYEPLSADLRENSERHEFLADRLRSIEANLADLRLAKNDLDAIRREIDETRIRLQGELAEHAKQPHGGPPPSDDLTKIWGVGKVLARRLNEMGIHTFAQIAAFTEEDIERVQEGLDTIPDRIDREEWVKQAGNLATGGAPRPMATTAH